MLFNRDVFVYVLATDEGIVEHVAYSKEVNEIAWHITHEVGEPTLDEWQNATANYHHHEDTAGLSCVFSKSFSSKVKDTCPHD